LIISNYYQWNPQVLIELFVATGGMAFFVYDGWVAITGWGWRTGRTGSDPGGGDEPEGA